MSGCLALLGLTVSCNDELYMGGVGVVPATKAYYLYTVSYTHLTLPTNREV